MNLMDELKVANSTIDMLRAGISRLQAEYNHLKFDYDDKSKYCQDLKDQLRTAEQENERLTRELNYNCKNEIAPCPLLVTAEQRVARECWNIINKGLLRKDMRREIELKYGI